MPLQLSNLERRIETILIQTPGVSLDHDREIGKYCTIASKVQFGCGYKAGMLSSVLQLKRFSVDHNMGRKP